MRGRGAGRVVADPAGHDAVGAAPPDDRDQPAAVTGDEQLGDRASAHTGYVDGAGGTVLDHDHAGAPGTAVEDPDPVAVVPARRCEVDGAPGETSTTGTIRLRGRTRALVSSPLDLSEVYGVSGRVVVDLTRPERTVPDLPRGLTSLTYPG